MAAQHNAVMLIRENDKIELRVYTNATAERYPLTEYQLVLLNYLSSQLIWQHFKLVDREA